MKLEYIHKKEITEHDNGHIHEIVRNQYRGQQSFCIIQQISDFRWDYAEDLFSAENIGILPFCSSRHSGMPFHILSVIINIGTLHFVS